MQKLLASSILLLVLCQALAHTHHNCIHDDIDHKFEHHHEHIKKEEIARRGLAGETYGPFRIIANYENLAGLSQDKIDYLTKSLFPEVLKYFSNALSVVQIATPLTFGAGKCNSAPIPKSLQSPGLSADLVLLVTAFETDPGLLAWASPCLLQGDGRPILGQVNFNPIHANADPARHAGNIALLQHEITHVLGFSGGLFDYWRNGGVKPYTKTNYRGQTVTSLNTSRVVEVARRHFGCSNITSVDIEQEGSGASAGSHWERRLFGNEAMTASLSNDAKFSYFTFALLEDSGWYKANYNYAAVLSFGRNSGCGFLFQTCIDNTTKAARFPEFCSATNQKPVCTLDGSAKGVCATSKQSVTPTMNYFGDSTTGFDPFMDECPSILGYSNGNCADTTQSPRYWLPEKYGNTSKCFAGSLLSNPYYANGWYDTACYPAACKVVNGVTRLYVTLGTKEYLCPLGGGQITNIEGANGFIECPAEKWYCPAPLSIINPNIAVAKGITEAPSVGPNKNPDMFLGMV